MKAILIIACLSVLAGCSQTPQELDSVYKGEKACVDAGLIVYHISDNTVRCEPYDHPKS